MGEISTWNHTVAAFVKTSPHLHHYLRHNLHREPHEPFASEEAALHGHKPPTA